ncbi:signal peptidase I [Patescibacteria group bacterium]|nr:signal peptidase I [Patescibacteria group bacterium]
MAKIPRGTVNIILDVIELILISTTVFIVVYFFIGQLLEVSGDSMTPAFYDKERLIAEKVSVKFKEPERGDIVIFVNPNYPEVNQRLIIKRVVGLPDEVIRISEGKVYVDDQPLDETYLTDGTVTAGRDAIAEEVSYKIDKDAYVLLGDNREHSKDSREWGAIKVDRIIGRALFVYYPLGKARFVK